MYTKVNVFRVWCEDLDMIASLNNEILEGLLPVEKPLLKPYMDKFDAAIEDIDGKMAGQADEKTALSPPPSWMADMSVPSLEDSLTPSETASVNASVSS